MERFVSRPNWMDHRFCAIWLLLWVALMGCRPKVRQGPQLPRRSTPIVKLRKHQGVHLTYDIYNTSGATFQGLAIVIEGEGCDGPREHRLLVKLSPPPLHDGTMRPFSHAMPYGCQHFKIKAHDIPSFKQALKRSHHPFVQFSRQGRQVIFDVQNRSILPFRGLAILIRGTKCEGPQPTRYWLDGTRLWLYPGYKRRFHKRLNADCLKIHVIAQDLVSFIQRRRAYMRARQAQQRKLREAAKRLLQGL